MGFGFWVLGFGFWVLGFGFWVLGFGFWVLTFRGITNAEGKVFSRMSRRDAARRRVEPGANRAGSVRKTLLPRAPAQRAVVFAG